MLDVNEQDDHYRFLNRKSDTKADIVKLLIDHGADVTAQDETQSTPLHLAAYHRSTQTVWLLIEHGADVAARDRSNKTPLHLALAKVNSPLRYL